MCRKSETKGDRGDKTAVKFRGDPWYTTDSWSNEGRVVNTESEYASANTRSTSKSAGEQLAEPPTSVLRRERSSSSSETD